MTTGWHCGEHLKYVDFTNFEQLIYTFFDSLSRYMHSNPLHTAHEIQHIARNSYNLDISYCLRISEYAY